MTDKTKRKFKIKEKKKSIQEDDDFELSIDIENEQYILAHVLKSENLQTYFYDNAIFEDFLIDNHKGISWCIKEAINRQREVTPEYLQILISEYPGQKKFTGLKYLYDLINSQDIEEPKIENFTDHTQRLKNDKVKHDLYYGLAGNLFNLLRDPHSNIEAIHDKTTNISTMIEGVVSSTSNSFVTMSEVNTQHDAVMLEREKGIDFQSIGYRQIDEKLTEGLAKKKISIIAGRPGMCKSAFVDNISLRLGVKNIPNAIFSLEMDRIGAYDRFVSVKSQIPLKRLIKERKSLTEDERKIESICKKDITELPIFIYDKAGTTLEMIQKQLKYIKDTSDVEVVFIDLLDKVQIPKHLLNKNTSDQIFFMLNFLQQLAKSMDVHICIVSQLNRQVEQRSNKRPMISDLKNSGAFEEVADLIFLLYRDSYYLSENDKNAYFNKTGGVDVLEINIAKQRQGEVGVVKAEYIGEITKIGRYKG